MYDNSQNENMYKHKYIKHDERLENEISSNMGLILFKKQVSQKKCFFLHLKLT